MNIELSLGYRLFNRIRNCLRKLCNTLYYCFSNKKKILVVNAPLIQFINKIEPYNIGDDLNYYLLHELTGRRVFVYHEFYHIKNHLSNLLAIGSIIDWLSDRKSLVWGSGILVPPSEQETKPIFDIGKVYAVRGKKTRECLLKAGFSCPEVYGDPALLLPLVYNPIVKKIEGRIGFIPHFVDINDENIIRLMKECGNNALLIKVQNYNSWKEFVEQILSCEFIISSSLHGLILSDAYGIPNQWISLASLPGGLFKYEDYYSAVGKDVECVKVSATTTIGDLLKKRDQYKEISFDYTPLLKACPFNITNEVAIRFLKNPN